MDWFARDFIKASLVWLGLGVTLGVLMAVEPALTIYTPAHMHMNLLGFVTMMIYGVAYHVLPRFTGHPLWSRRLPAWHLFASNAGLALIVSGFALRVHPGAMVAAGTIVIATGGAASAFGAYAFILNMWKTIDGRTVAPIVVPHAPPARALRVLSTDRNAIQAKQTVPDRSS